MLSTINEIIRKRDLIRQLVLKDLKVRYARSFFGLFWVFLSPFLTVGIFYVIFCLVIKIKIEEAPFILYLMSAVFSWRFFQDSIMSSVTSLVDNRNLIKESNFAHYLIPVAIVFTNLLIFLPSLSVLIVISLFVLKGLPIFIIFLPFVLLIHLIITTGLSVIFSLLYVRYRDIKHILEAVLLLLFYLTPAFYSIYLVKSAFPPLLYRIYIDNPFVAMLNLYRFTVLKGFYGAIKEGADLFFAIIISLSFALLVLLTGVYLYRKNKNTVNDYLAY